MNKILTFVAVALAGAAAFGELSWATINTAAYEKDATLSQAGTSAYTAYLCTVEAARDTFGSDAVEGVTTYFANHFAAGSTALADLTSGDLGAKLEFGATALDAAEWGRDQYSFTTYFASGLAGNLVAGGDYLGIILYSSDEGQAVRVFSATASDTPTWTADDSVARAAGSAGVWTAAVPEPTGGLMLLLGLSALALRRRRA